MSSCFVYELPTTGALSFNDFCIDRENVYTVELADATAARANVRAVLKENKRADEKDYLRIVKAVDDYLSHLYGIIACINSGDLVLRHEPMFSWRSTLSSHLFNNSPRISLPGLHCDLAFSLLTYAFALSNMASFVLESLGTYETQKHITDTERKAKDERLNFAVNLLCRASGVFAHLGEVVLVDWNRYTGEVKDRPPDLSKEVVAALSRLSLSDAQALAIRKLLTKSAYDSTISPGPPLPESHPSPALISKLYLHITSQYSSARNLVKTPSASGEVDAELRRYLSDESIFASALAHKWLGVDAGESNRGGEAVGFLKWAKEEMEGLKEGKGVGKINVPHGGGSEKGKKKERIVDELASMQMFLTNYKRQNDTVHFLPVPPMSSLQALVPDGRSAVTLKAFEPPKPAFGPGSNAYVRKESEKEASPQVEPFQSSSPSATSPAEYAGAGSYF